MIFNWLASANKFASAGTSLANQQTDLAKAVRLVEEGNVPLTNDNADERQRNRRVEIYVLDPATPLVGWADTHSVVR